MLKAGVTRRLELAQCRVGPLARSGGTLLQVRHLGLIPLQLNPAWGAEWGLDIVYEL